MKRVLLIISLLLASVLGARAQDKILVTGTVSSSVEGVSMQGTRIYAFSSVKIGLHERDRIEMDYESGGYMPEYNFVESIADASGYYEVQVPPGGYLIFYKFPYKPVCVKVNGRDEHNVEIEATQELDESTVSVEAKKKTKKGKPVMHGNTLDMPVYYYFNEDMMGAVEGLGKTNARLVAQAYIINSDGSDTLHYFTPRVYDGEQFHNTQYHWRNDALYELAENMPRLKEEKDSITFHVSYKFPDEDQSLYYCKAKIWVEDYLNVYYQDSIDIFNTGRVARPFQFLEYSFDECNLDPKKYFKEPRRENVSDAKNLKLQFNEGKAELDVNDEATMKALADLKEEIRTICADATSTLIELSFEGYASPDGNYAKNLDLSDRRTKTVQREVESFRSDELLRADRFAKGYVAPWTDVADLLEKNSMKAEAEDIRKIVEQAPDNMDKQGALMRGLPYYKDKVVPILPELRSVKCKHSAIVKRFLEPEEILAKYNTDSLFRAGKKLVTLNEYWHLFDLVKDEKQLESLYLRGLNASYKSEGKFWPLPANNLAVMYLKRKQVDTTILSSFIDERYMANQPWTDKDGNPDYDRNPDAIVANQVQMFMLLKDYERAEELSSIIEKEHPKLRAIVRCLGNYIDFDDPKEEATVNLIMSSSPRNEVVIKLFKDPINDTTIYESLNKLNLNDPVTPYLKAQYICLKYDNDVVAMGNNTFNRDKDPNFSHPKDEIIPASTPEEIEAQKKEVERIKGDMELEAMFGEVSEFTKNELKGAEDLLAVMEKGEVGLKPYTGFTEYEAAKVYLQQCFNMNSKYIKTAQADYDIAEDLLNDVLGIKKDTRK